MVGKPLHKIQCESYTRSSNYQKQCRAKGYFQKTSGKVRCRHHGGFSTGPRSEKGRLTALRNLNCFKNYTDEELLKWIKLKRYAKD